MKDKKEKKPFAIAEAIISGFGWVIDALIYIPRLIGSILKSLF